MRGDRCRWARLRDPAKKNQLTLYRDVEELFAEKREPECVRVEKGHGRLERREIRTSEDLSGYSDFPGLGQVAEIRTKVVFMKSGEVREDAHYVLTSLSAKRAGPPCVLSLMRGHWGIENKAFHVKDDGFGEDRHVLGSHHSGAAMSLLRGAAINLLRGRSTLWGDDEPITGRAQAISAQPLTILSAIR